MRLLVITQDFPPQVGGIQTYCAELALRLYARCERLEVVAPRDPGWEAVDAGLPYRVHRLPLGADGMRATTVAATPVIARRGFDATLHAQWYTAHAGLLARRLGLVRRVFVAAHGRELLLNEPAALSPVLGRGFERLRGGIARGVDRWFPVSRYTAGILVEQGIDRERIVVVSNGVDPNRRAPTPSDRWRAHHGLGDDPVVLTLCRLVPRKGIDTVLRAFGSIAERVPKARYVVAGTGPDRERLEDLTRALNLVGRVTFVGRVPEEELNACFGAANVFVMPARSEPPDVEGFGLVFLEASACERPVVGARSGGIPDAIVPGETGELVEPDDAEALASVVVGLLRDPDRARAMGKRGRARVLSGCTWDHAAGALFEAMEEALR
jgi:phosphatidyl-myo-inositol dimannoside synthase